ncbi:MAG: alpha-2-macroglobulin, partial [Verrucomicrobiae bacterium]|nr:alpha-2-macroglobulin [Verrucomicrobiae bacterium]
MNLRFRLVFPALALALMLAARAADLPAEFQRAEEFYARGSFAQALEVLNGIHTNGLSVAQNRWRQFRLADARWRAADSAQLPPAEEMAPELITLANPETPAAARDEIWADANVSLADFHRRRQDPWDWLAIRYGAALGWWAGQTNVPVARQRYLDIVRKWAESLGGPQMMGAQMGFHDDIPDDVLDHAVTLAQRPEEIAPFRLARAVRFANRGGPRSLGQVERDFDAARKAAVGTPWLDEALFQEAQWLQQAGRVSVSPDGRWERRPDLPRALTLYRQLVEEFPPGKSRYREPAEQQIRQLTQPAVGMSQAGVFLPGSEIEFHLWARNATNVALTLRAVELTRDVRFDDAKKDAGHWFDLLKAPEGPALRTWTETLTPPGPYEQADRTVRLSEKLPPGAYLLEARTGEEMARELVMVTDAVLVLQQSGERTAAWLVDALNGRPIPEAPVKLGLYYTTGAEHRREWKEQSKFTDANGLAMFDLAGGELIGVAGPGTRPAVARLYAGGFGSVVEGWKIFAFTDRPAYRPGDLVQWNILARRRVDGQYQTPAGSELRYAIQDPQGTTLTNGILKLDAFGAAWTSLTLGAAPPLGVYRVHFSEGARQDPVVGSAELFRLEEYRLPEFEVVVKAPEETGPDGVPRRKLFRPGDPLTVTLEAKYFFGAPVGGGVAEVIVRRGNFSWGWPEPREYPWLYGPGPLRPVQPWRGMAEGIRRASVTLDAQGRATFTQETDPDEGDAQYILEVAVTDTARRVQRATSEFNVTRQGYSVRGQPAHNLPRPGDTVRIEFRAQDANQQPLSVEGSVKITRDFWWEVWLDSFGREVEGEELKRRQAQSAIWPPKPEPGHRDWRLKFRGYRSDELATRAVQLGTNGVGELSFTPEREGYYRLAWSSPDIWAIPGAPVAVTNRVTAEAAVWVTSGRVADLGYRVGGVQIVVDQDTFRPGQKAPVLIVGPNPDRWVLFTIEGGGASAPQVLHFEHTTKLVEVEVTEALQPNAFLHAALVQDRQVFQATQEMVVPPVNHFLNVEVIPDAVESRPGGEAGVRVVTRDVEGRPVATQVALAVVDESLFKIQKDLAGDPRAFFFGERRSSRVQGGSSFNERNYVRLVKGADGDWYDDRNPPEASLPPEFRDMDMDGAQRMEPGLARRYGLSLRKGAGVNRFVGRFEMPAASSGLSLGWSDYDADMTYNPYFYSGVALEDQKSLGEGDAVVVVRKDFRETAFWQPSVLTDEDGQARVTFHYPDSTTRWATRAIAASRGSQFGEGRTNTVTKLPLMVRWQMPRFLVAGDEATLTTSMDNNTSAPLTVTPSVAVEGIELIGWYRDGRLETGTPAAIVVPAGGTVRVDWAVRATKPGTAVCTAMVRAAGFSDAMRREFNVVENGIDQQISRSGKATTGDVAVTLNLPPRKPGTTRFTVSITPSLAVAMLDALPYLADYPYGCTEQTLSRFLPAVVVRRTLAAVGLDAEEAMRRAFGGISTNAAGQVSPALGTKKDLGKLDDMIAAGLKRLGDGQNENGSWGW